MSLIHTCYRITNIDRSVAFYEALGFKEAGRFPIREEAINVFMGLPEDGPEPRLELTYNVGHDEPYDLGTGYGHIAITAADLDGALARAGGKQTPFGAFLDSTTDRVGEGCMLGAIALIFSRQDNQIALAFAIVAIAGSFLVSYTRARAEALGLRGDVGIGSRAERVAVITAGLVLAPWGALQWTIYLLAATASITVVQRILSVRSQLRRQ